MIILLGWFGIRTIMEKMVDRVCQPGTISRQHSAKAYGLHMTYKGDPQCVKQHQRLLFGYCGAELEMVSHLKTHHIWWEQARPLSQPLSLLMPNEYGSAFLRMATSINLPVEGFPVRATSCTNLWIHFMCRYLEDTVMVLNKDPDPHPWYKQWNMFITCETMAARYLGIKICKRGVWWNRRCLAGTAAQVAVGMEFWAWYHVLEKVYIFKYLGMIISFNDRNLLAIGCNLQIKKRKWGRLSHLMC